MVSTSTKFSDIQNNWARLFIEGLAQKGIVNGLGNGTFRPDVSMTRAEYAVILSQAFKKAQKKRNFANFLDVPENYWARSAIQFAHEAGFLSGFIDNRFRPDTRISRMDALLALVAGLNIGEKIKPELANSLSEIYQDVKNLPTFAINPIAIATTASLVSSHPNIKLLNPTLPATRADISAFIYQALVYLGELPRINSDFIIVPKIGSNPNTPTPINPPKPTTVEVNHRREFRGAWIACVWNSDYPSKQGLPVDLQKAELFEILNKLQSLNFNAVIFQVRPEGDAVYASQLEPWSAWLSGQQGKSPGYDPLEFVISECRKRNIEVHAWFNPYRAKTSTNNFPNVRPHISVTNPEVVYKWGNQLWMDPGSKIVQDKAFDVIMDVLRRYDVDGIHLDDYFYPYPIQGQSFPDDKTYATYKSGGGKMSLSDWRRENVNIMVERLSTWIKSVKPHVKFGISPFGIYRPGQPVGITGLDAYEVLYADSKKWLEKGWVDYLAPQLYWRTDQAKQGYQPLLKWWTEVNTKQRHIYAGNNIGQLDGKAWKNEEIDKQVKISRSLFTSLSLGNIFFSMSSITDNRQDIADKFQSGIYPRPALVPTMPWKNNSNSSTLPSTPTGLKVENRRLSWNAVNDNKIRSWTLYRQTGDTWTLTRVLSRGTNFATVETGTYAICAVDKMANESLGSLINVG